MGSTRLPKKVSLSLSPVHSLLSYLLINIKRCQLIDKIIVATSSSSADDIIEKIAVASDVNIFRGSEDDVLSRYAQAASYFGIDSIVRVVSDNPFTQPSLVDQMVKIWTAVSDVDYCSNIIEETFPIGMHVEIFSLDALLQADQEAQLSEDREHVTPYIYNNPEQFSLASCYSESDLSSFRFTVDYPSDLVFARAVYSAIEDKKISSVGDLCSIVDSIPGLKDINCKYKKPHSIARTELLKTRRFRVF